MLNFTFFLLKVCCCCCCDKNLSIKINIDPEYQVVDKVVVVLSRIIKPHTVLVFLSGKAYVC
jgi:hypothetical protein